MPARAHRLAATPAQIAQFQSVAFGRKSCSQLPDYDLAAICRGRCRASRS